VSHAANDPRPAPSPFVRRFDWTGTLADRRTWLPDRLAEVARMVDGGWPAVMARNHALALGAREVLWARSAGRRWRPRRCSARWRPWRPAAFGPPPVSPVDEDPLQAALRERAGIEVPLVAWPRDPGPGDRRWRLVRVSCPSTTSFPTTSRSRTRSCAPGTLGA